MSYALPCDTSQKLGMLSQYGLLGGSFLTALPGLRSPSLANFRAGGGQQQTLPGGMQLAQQQQPPPQQQTLKQQFENNGGKIVLDYGGNTVFSTHEKVQCQSCGVTYFSVSGTQPCPPCRQASSPPPSARMARTWPGGALPLISLSSSPASNKPTSQPLPTDGGQQQAKPQGEEGLQQQPQPPSASPTMVTSQIISKPPGGEGAQQQPQQPCASPTVSEGGAAAAEAMTQSPESPSARRKANLTQSPRVIRFQSFPLRCEDRSRSLPKFAPAEDFTNPSPRRTPPLMKRPIKGVGDDDGLHDAQSPAKPFFPRHQPRATLLTPKLDQGSPREEKPPPVVPSPEKKEAVRRLRRSASTLDGSSPVRRVAWPTQSPREGRPRGCGLGVTIALDLDQVLGDYLSAYVAYRNWRLNVGPEVSVMDYQAYAEALRCGASPGSIKAMFHESEDFPSTVAVIPGAFEALQKLKEMGYRLVVVTSRSYEVCQETLTWLDDNFKDVNGRGLFPPDCVVLTGGGMQRKVDVCKKLGATVLVDDEPTHIKECVAEGVKGVLFDFERTYHWNQKAQLPAGGGGVRLHSWDEVTEWIVVNCMGKLS